MDSQAEQPCAGSPGSLQRVILPGGAGLVGQNLVLHLKQHGYSNLVVLDKHRHNLQLLADMHPDLTTERADLADYGSWERHFEGADCVIMLQAQIGGLDYSTFIRNTLTSTANLLHAIEKYQIPHVILVSSSVVKSTANDHYTETKRRQEDMVLGSGIPNVVLRPTLMFGWFDRKHLGWLSRFMHRTPLFPIPGDGRYMRQPLYVRDFCAIVASCLERRIAGRVYDISGIEKIEFIDIIREIKRASKAKTAIVRIPYRSFHRLLGIWALIDSDPPFTTSQLEALVANDEFEVMDWPGEFGVTPTSLRTAMEETFGDSKYSRIALKF